MLGFLRQLMVVALISGSLAGALSWLAHMAGTTPLILQAETYEKSDAGALLSAPSESEQQDTHVHEAFEPEDGWERNLFTLGADIVTGVGFAMAMVAGFALFGRRIDFRQGLMWGMAGFAAFALAPALGLPPQLPGAVEAPLGERQFWWALTAASTLVGIAAIARMRSLKGWAIGIVLIAAPHVVGAPQPLQHGQSAPAELQATFVWVAIATALVFWLALGGIAGAAYKRLGPRLAAD